MRGVVIVGAARTAIGTFGGGLKGFSATELGTIVVREVMKRAGVPPESVDEVIMGNVLQAGLGENPARQCAVRAGVSVEVPAYTVNKVCGSGLKAVALGSMAISAGDIDTVVAGGIESMTNAPYLLPKARWGYRMGDEVIVDSMLRDGLLDAFNDVHMGITAENLAERFKIGREEQDAFANESIRRTLAAIEQGHFREEIIPIEVPQKRGSPFIFDTDELQKLKPTPDVMRALRSAFKKDGTVTAGNSPGINDGAAAVVLMAQDRAEALGPSDWGQRLPAPRHPPLQSEATGETSRARHTVHRGRAGDRYGRRAVAAVVGHGSMKFQGTRVSGGAPQVAASAKTGRAPSAAQLGALLLDVGR